MGILQPGPRSGIHIRLPSTTIRPCPHVPIDKFNYLRSLLQGPALTAIAGLALTAANYTEAVTILEKRFGWHMDVLLNVTPLTSSSSLKTLRQLYDTVESHVRGLKSLGVDSGTYGSLLSSVLMNKLPQELRLIISRKVGDADWELDRLMAVLEEEVQTRERAVTHVTLPPKNAAKGPETASALLAKGSDSTPTCCYCNQLHYSNVCRTVESIEERKRILREKGRCYICLKRGHISRQCPSKMRCFQCQGRHITAAFVIGNPQQ